MLSEKSFQKKVYWKSCPKKVYKCTEKSIKVQTYFSSEEGTLPQTFFCQIKLIFKNSSWGFKSSHTAFSGDAVEQQGDSIFRDKIGSDKANLVCKICEHQFHKEAALKVSLWR